MGYIKYDFIGKGIVYPFASPFCHPEHSEGSRWTIVDSSVALLTQNDQQAHPFFYVNHGGRARRKLYNLFLIVLCSAETAASDTAGLPPVDASLRRGNIFYK